MHADWGLPPQGDDGHPAQDPTDRPARPRVPADETSDDNLQDDSRNGMGGALCSPDGADAFVNMDELHYSEGIFSGVMVTNQCSSSPAGGHSAECIEQMFPSSL